MARSIHRRTRHVDQAEDRSTGAAPLHRLPHQGAGAITVDQYVGFREQPLEHPSVVGFVEIEWRASLRSARQGRLPARPVGRIDPEDIGPKSARKRVATGPASTRVRSSTLTPAKVCLQRDARPGARLLGPARA